MAKGHQIVRSEDATTVVIRGDVRNPEPTHAIIAFPGGTVEVARCSDGTYWAHLALLPRGAIGDESFAVLASRVDYNHEGWGEHGIPEIPSAHLVEKLSLRIGRYVVGEVQP